MPLMVMLLTVVFLRRRLLLDTGVSLVITPDSFAGGGGVHLYSADEMCAGCLLGVCSCWYVSMSSSPPTAGGAAVALAHDDESSSSAW